MTLVFDHLLLALGALITAVAVVIMLQQRRTPQSAAAWLLFMVVVPYIGVPLFLLLGFRKRGGRFAALRLTSPTPFEDTSREAARFLAALGGPAASRGNTFELQAAGPDAHAALEDVIDSARERLDVLLYIIENDEIGRAFVRRLTEKARAGVKVRLCLDRVGSFLRPRAELARFVKAGGELQFFAPFLQPPGSGHMNLRNHRKLVIADRSRAWAGGRNVGRHYLGAPPEGWHDLSFTVAGPAVAEFAQIYASDWAVTASGAEPLPPHPPPAGNAVLQTIVAGPDEPDDVLHKGLLGLIHRAERRVWIATPYFIPSEALQLALESAAQRGVDVRILVPDRSNHRVADLARGPWLRDLEEAGAKICRFTPGMIHAKAGLIDDTAWTGSANFDVRSILLNFELAVFCHDPVSVAQLEGWFLHHVGACEIGLPPTPLVRRLIEGLFRLGSPIL